MIEIDWQGIALGRIFVSSCATERLGRLSLTGQVRDRLFLLLPRFPYLRKKVDCNENA